MVDTVTLYATAGNPEDARRLARHLLEARLVACANLMPTTSLYWWEGEIEEADEVALVMKTTRERADEAVAAIEEAHEYDVPCAIVLPHEGGLAAYRQWVEGEVRG